MLTVEFAADLAEIIQDFPCPFVFNGTGYTGLCPKTTQGGKADLGGVWLDSDARLQVPCSALPAGAVCLNDIVVIGSGTFVVRQIETHPTGVTQTLALTHSS